MKLRHFYGHWELWKIVKNNWKGKMIGFRNFSIFFWKFILHDRISRILLKGYYMLWLSFGQILTFYLNLSQHTVHEDFNHHILVLSVGVAINAFIIILLHIWGCSKYCGRNAFHNVATARTNSHTNLYATTISLDFLHSLVEFDSFLVWNVYFDNLRKNQFVMNFFF